MGRGAELADKLLREEEEEDEEGAKRARIGSATAAVPPPSMPVRSATMEVPIVSTTIRDPLSSSPQNRIKKKKDCCFASQSLSLAQIIVLFSLTLLGFTILLLVAIWAFQDKGRR